MRKKIAVILALLVALSLAAYITLIPKPLETPDSVSSLIELEEHLEKLTGYNADSPPGLSLVVVKDREIVYQRGFGLADGPRNIPAAPDTVYNYWSITKIPTAMAILQLQEQGLLSIEDPVADHLPFFDVQYPAADNEVVTVRHLLNHSSGLPNNLPEILRWTHTDGDPEWNQTELIREKLPDYSALAYEPGSKGMYTNVGYMVLAAVIEAASGETYEHYITKHILEPLEMHQTGFNYTDSMIAAEATGAHPAIDIQSLLLTILGVDTDRLVREERDGMMWFNHIYSDQNGPTGLIGPPTDLARLAMAYMNGGELNGKRFLSSKSVAIMTNSGHVKAGDSPDAADFDEMYHGLGWFVIPTQTAEDGFYLTHSGGGPGFSTNMRLYPSSKLGVVIMANGTYLDRERILDLVVSLDWTHPEPQVGASSP